MIDKFHQVWLTPDLLVIVFEKLLRIDWVHKMGNEQAVYYVSMQEGHVKEFLARL